MRPMTTQQWAQHLRKGDGQGLVPVDVARSLLDGGYIKSFAIKSGDKSSVVMVKLKDR